jgi:hypothetical protein
MHFKGIATKRRPSAASRSINALRHLPASNCRSISVAEASFQTFSSLNRRADVAGGELNRQNPPVSHSEHSHSSEVYPEKVYFLCAFLKISQ